VEGYADDVVALLRVQVAIHAVRDAARSLVETEYAFGQEQAGCQLEVGARRPHHHDDARQPMTRPTEPDLEWLLGDDGVRSTPYVIDKDLVDDSPCHRARPPAEAHSARVAARLRSPRTTCLLPRLMPDVNA